MFTAIGTLVRLVALFVVVGFIIVGGVAADWSFTQEPEYPNVTYVTQPCDAPSNVSACIP